MDTRTCRLTGTPTTVGRAEELGLDPEHPWYVVCEAHSTILGTATRRAADRHRVRPDGWCVDCREELSGGARIELTAAQADQVCWAESAMVDFARSRDSDYDPDDFEVAPDGGWIILRSRAAAEDLVYRLTEILPDLAGADGGVQHNPERGGALRAAYNAADKIRDAFADID